MADLSPSSSSGAMAPVTEEIFLDDRKQFWSFFTSLVFAGTAFVVVLLILLAFFLV